ncbi:MAG: hypothetical protein PUC28_13640 [Blautia sp.]|nr:hypothetical protein [Blautia sp.]
MPKLYYTSNAEIHGYGEQINVGAVNVPVEPGVQKAAEFGGIYRDGLIVSKDIADQLAGEENKAVSNFYYFQQVPDSDQYLVRQKLPEYIAGNDGQPVEFRKNMNYVYKAMARHMISPDGKVDLQNGAKEMNDLAIFAGLGIDDYARQKASPEQQKEIYGQVTGREAKNEQRLKRNKFVADQYKNYLYDHFVKYAGIPEEDRESFKQFIFTDRIGNPSKYQDLNGKTIDAGLLQGNFFMDGKTSMARLTDRYAKLERLKEKQSRGEDLSEDENKNLGRYEKEVNGLVDMFQSMAEIDPNANYEIFSLEDTGMCLHRTMETAIKGCNALHPDQRIEYEETKFGGRKASDREMKKLMQLYEGDREYWDQLIPAKGYVPEKRNAILAEYRQAKEKSNEALARLEPLGILPHVIMDDEKRAEALNKHPEAEADVNVVLEEKRLKFQHGPILDLSENSQKEYTFQEFCEECSKGNIDLDEKDPKQKELSERLQVLKERGINPVIGDNRNQFPNASRKTMPVFNKSESEGFQMNVRINGENQKLTIQASTDIYDIDHVSQFHKTGIGIFKNEEEIKKYNGSGALTRDVDSAQFSDVCFTDIDNFKSVSREADLRVNSVVGLEELRGMDGEQFLAKLTGVTDKSEKRFDAYAKALESVNINGQSALSYLGAEGASELKDVAGNERKERFVTQLGTMMKDRLEDQFRVSREEELGDDGRKDSFCISKTNDNGNVIPLTVRQDKEVKAPGKEVTKPGFWWKLFHSKASIKERMNQVKAYQDQKKAYDTFVKEKEQISQYNEETKVDAGMTEKVQKRDTLEADARKAAGKKEEKEKGVERVSVNDLSTSKEKESKSKQKSDLGKQKSAEVKDPKKSQKVSVSYGK